ncbi:MAG: endonuclease III [Coriobacteriia bacterium]|nr:endonuclease III [Coriobacteriia bacterium]MCL2745944.1 endonuclease III [Coriobacteriia bacterium]MCL2871334.1 endonuclease III [Coriobacteriia bacterium]
MTKVKNKAADRQHAKRESQLDFPFPKAVSRIGPVIQARAAEVAARLKVAYPIPDDGTREQFLNFTNPYECVTAVALSAQTTDENVNKVLPTLFERWPDCATLITADQKELEKVVHSLGFYRQKARNLLGMARVVVDDYDGEIPGNMVDLLRLPGVARKTANIVLTESFGITQGIAIDTHVYRISTRLGLTRAKNPAAAEGDLCKAFDYTDWYHINHNMVAFGREICDARKPLCGKCILADICPSAGTAKD